MRDIQSIDNDKEIKNLLIMVPKTTPNKNEKEERILYQKLNYEL